jgi:dTDP-4-dehydrorhamnose 3,5-epimerase
VVRVIETALPGVLVIEPVTHVDARGFFLETFHAGRYAALAGVADTFVQDNHSRSNLGVLRGLHAQRRHPQGKLVRCARGAVYDVAVDIRPASATFGRWVGEVLSDENQRQLWIPPGFAHGFQVLSQVADFEYKCTAEYLGDDEIGVIWNDPDLGIEWPLDNPIVSGKDQRWPSLRTLAEQLR